MQLEASAAKIINLEHELLKEKGSVAELKVGDGDDNSLKYD